VEFRVISEAYNHQRQIYSSHVIILPAAYIHLIFAVEDDMRLIVKPVSCKPENFKTFMGDCAREVIQQLLLALTHRYDQNDDDNGGKKQV